MATKLEFSRGEVIAQKYEVVDLLDESPLGVTYRAKHLRNGLYVRITMLNPKCAGPEHKARIVSSFNSVQSLDHPHLCKVGELGEHNGIAFYTFEDFEGQTLRELLQEYRINSKTFAVKEAAQICMQILEALSEMHRHGLVMRALRPEYVLVNVRWTGPRRQTFVAQTKLTGGGLLDLVPTEVLAEDEFTRGEAQYLAPELKSFDPVPTPRSDVYSVGVIFYELLVGQAPIGTFQLPKMRRPDLPDHVNDVVDLALGQAPEDRYPSTQDFIYDIQRTFQDASLDEDLPRRPLVTPIGWGLALVLVAFIGVILFNLRPDQAKLDEARDAELRKEVFDQIQATRPPPEVFKAMYARHPQNMIYIPEGPFLAGRLNSEPDIGLGAGPIAEKRSTKGFLIDVFEYPNLKGAKPTFGLTYSEAEALCEERGKRLCTADEWERACKGPWSRIYSYGDYFDPEYCGNGVEDPYPSGTREQCKSEYGLFDISGGFREWTSTSPKKGRALVKGGLKSSPEKGTRCSMATDESTGFADQSISFRCCRNPDAPPVAQE
ncbi:MAG: SUMF1/EgtB/PvdO family nonheme iron enzyme [Myxococcales bacterium]|nr:SUMF1/EgtB/PvdO family nonheme iron enzyme [Myxococcales bacterium]